MLRGEAEFSFAATKGRSVLGRAHGDAREQEKSKLLWSILGVTNRLGFPRGLSFQRFPYLNSFEDSKSIGAATDSQVPGPREVRAAVCGAAQEVKAWIGDGWNSDVIRYSETGTDQPLAKVSKIRSR